MPSLESYVDKFGRLPTCITASFALYLAFYRGTKLENAGLIAMRPNGDSYIISDDRSVLEFYYEHKDDSAKDLVHAVCTNTDFWGRALTEIPGFETEVTKMLKNIEINGAYEQMRECL